MADRINPPQIILLQECDSIDAAAELFLNLAIESKTCIIMYRNADYDTIYVPMARGRISSARKDIKSALVLLHAMLGASNERSISETTTQGVQD
jgi:hypothetical protein